MAAKTASASHSQDALSLQVSLPQMLDLALGTPELGAVNFKVLHNFLHVLLHQTNLRLTKVEYRGDEANKMKDVIRSSKARSSLELHEYNIIDASGTLVKSGLGMDADVITDAEYSGKGGKPAASAPATARGKLGKEGSVTSLDSTNGTSGARKSTGITQKISSGIDGDRQSVIFVEPILDGATPTALGFKRLEDTVKDLQQKFQALDELANNPEMIERVRSSKGDPLSDMWHGINVSKRLDASEQGIEKLTTMVQDLIKSDNVKGDNVKSDNVKSDNVKSDNIEIDGKNSEEFGRLVERVTELENNVAYLGGDVAELKNAEGNRDGAIREIKSKTDQKTLSVKDDVSKPDDEAQLKIIEDKSQVEKKKTLPTSTRHSVVGGVDLTELKDNVKGLRSDITIVQKEVQDLSSRVNAVVSGSELVPARIDVSKSRNDDVSKSPSAAGVIDEIALDETNVASKKTASKLSVASGTQVTEKKRTPSSSHVTLVEGHKSNTLKELGTRVTEVENIIACITEKINSEERSSEINDLVTKIQEIQADMEKINETASRLMEDKENRDTHRDALVEQIELLKTIKADKEDLEDALADKADAQTVNRKVSHDQFDTACDDLARGLEDAITKLSQQESIWQQALEEVQKEIEGKLDKVEISPLKEFVNKRLKFLQEKLKALADMRRENEAAGTKRMLSDVQCISCDANAVMRMDEGIQYKPPAMHSTKSIKPYLTYELDQVRKQQRKLPHSRNMIQFEAAMQEMTRKAKPLKEDTLAKSPRDHLCNRYCGGSHTITTPQQRVMRMGHFLSQWGPEVVQLSEGVVLGNDGQLYRSREMPPHTPRKPDVCGPCGDEDNAESLCSTTPVPEPVPVSQRQSELNQKRSSIVQVSKRSSARKSSERIKETVEQKMEKMEKISAEPSTPPNAPPGTIVDEGDAVPEPSGPADEVVHVERSQSGNQDLEEMEGEGNFGE